MTTDKAALLPMPPLDLLQRTGNVGDESPHEATLAIGRYLRELIESLLPEGWSWKGKRVLDFGCGAGKVLRQFADVADEAEFWGCDIHEPSIVWVQDNFCPPFQAFTCREEPGLPQEDGYFDLIFALSVYTHITDHWAGWMLEHHRALKDGGLLIASFLGEAMIEPLIAQKWTDEGIGMNALLAGYPWDLGGPITFISPWWLRAHWGRAFEILKLNPYTEETPPSGHGMVLMQRKPVELTIADLERLEPDEPRELTALHHHIWQLREETLQLRRAHDDLAVRVNAAEAALASAPPPPPPPLSSAAPPAGSANAVQRRLRQAARSRGWLRS